MNLRGLATGEAAARVPLRLRSMGQRTDTRLAGLFSALVSLALLIIVGHHLLVTPMGIIREIVPVSIRFWLVFAAYYLVGPASEWIIYRRLWHIPAAGFGALLRKLVSNELLLGYLGEVQFYAWVRSRMEFATAPFGSIKDVTVLSALTGNIATLVMLACAWPLVSSGATGLEMKTAFLSLGVVLITSFAILLLRQKLFTLPRRELFFITAVHSGRIVAVVGLAALMWHIVLPEVSLGLWLVLATLRMLVSRLPLVPNKDVVFAGLAVFLMGHEVQIASLMTMMAALLLIVHLCVGAAFAVGDLLGAGRTT